MSTDAEQPTLHALAHDFAVAARTVIDAAEALDDWLATHGDNPQAREYLRLMTDLHLGLVRMFGDAFLNEPLKIEQSAIDTIKGL